MKPADANSEGGRNGDSGMTSAHDIVRIKITLDNVKPTVLRRIEVPVRCKHTYACLRGRMRGDSRFL